MSVIQLKNSFHVFNPVVCKLLHVLIKLDRAKELLNLYELALILLLSLLLLQSSLKIVNHFNWWLSSRLKFGYECCLGASALTTGCFNLILRFFRGKPFSSLHMVHNGFIVASDGVVLCGWPPQSALVMCVLVISAFLLFHLHQLLHWLELFFHSLVV